MPDDLKKRGSPDNKRISKQPWEQRYQQQKRQRPTKKKTNHKEN